MKIEIKDIKINHPSEGILNKKIIIYYDDDENEFTRENYTESHPLYGIDPNNLTRSDRFIIKQMLGI